MADYFKQAMKKLIIVILIGVVAVGFLFFIFRNNNQPSTAQVLNNLISENQNSMEKQPAEKIEVVHFHGTHQCWSCITVGEYALKTIKEKFPEEYENGTIEFKDINGELSENKEMVIKYQARGSSLFVNAIKNGQDDIGEDVEVWRLVTNETQYINYFENKLKTLLGK